MGGFDSLALPPFLFVRMRSQRPGSRVPGRRAPGDRVASFSLNPFDLAGPEFLGFYVGLGVIVFGLLLVALRLHRRGTGSLRLPRDPYEAAYLRGGSRGVAEVAALALVAKSLVRIADGTARLERTSAAQDGELRDVESVALLEIESGAGISRLTASPRFRTEVDTIVAGLQRSGHLMSPSALRGWRTAVGVAAFVLLGTATTKLFLALARGHTNVLLLIALAATFGLLLRKFHRHAATTDGHSTRRALRALFRTGKPVLATSAGLRDDRETLFTAAVLGITGGPFTRLLGLGYRNPDGGPGWYGCGSTGGGASSCGGGAGDGGGGGGGGCGGCSG